MGLREVKEGERQRRREGFFLRSRLWKRMKGGWEPQQQVESRTIHSLSELMGGSSSRQQHHGARGEEVHKGGGEEG